MNMCMKFYSDPSKSWQDISLLTTQIFLMSSLEEDLKLGVNQCVVASL